MLCITSPHYLVTNNIIVTLMFLIFHNKYYTIETCDHLMEVDNHYINAVRLEFQLIEASFVDEEFDILAKIVCQVYGLDIDVPNSFDNAMKVFCVLLSVFEDL